MRVLRFGKSLYIWIILSVVIHVAVFRWVRFEKQEVGDYQQKYEVKLVYYKPRMEEPKVVSKKEKPKVLRKVKKQTVVENLVEKDEVPLQTEEMVSEIEDHLQIVEEESIDQIQREPEIVEQEADESLQSVLAVLEKAEERHHLGPVEEIISEARYMKDLSVTMEGLRKRLLEHQIYPAAARKKGYQGIVYLQIELDSEGNLIELQVTESSGYKILDKAAISLIKKVVPFDHGMGKRISVEIPIKYNLIE